VLEGNSCPGKEAPAGVRSNVRQRVGGAIGMGLELVAVLTSVHQNGLLPFLTQDPTRPTFDDDIDSRPMLDPAFPVSSLSNTPATFRPGIRAGNVAARVG
jgi:hypothetical protein